MAAEFVFSPPAGGGGNPTPGGHSKKKGMNKLYLYIGGALVIMLYIIFIKRTTPQQDTAVADPTGYPQNSVDVAAQLQNNADILQGNMNATLNQFQAQLNSEYGTQLNAITAKMDAFQGQVDQLNAHPNPEQTATPAVNTNVQAELQTIKDRVDLLYNPDMNKGIAGTIGPQGTTTVTHVGSWYTVQQGDTLTNIAQRAYVGKNPAITTNWITGDTNNKSVNFNSLQPGQKIYLTTG
jgi:LysM repeat protein